MGRRKKDDGVSVSLFPFLSVLACVIGVLTLMITALALSQLEKPDAQVLEDADQYEKLVKENEKKRDDLDNLKDIILRANALRNELKLAREELGRLESHKKKRDELIRDQKKLEAERLRLLAEANRLRQRIAAIEPEMKPLEEELKKLKAELAKRKLPPPEAVVRIQPGGSGLDLVPTFVECNRVGIVIYDGKELTRISRGAVAKDEKWLKLLDRVANQKKGTIVFLVRRDGIGTYYTARSIARQRYCRNGKLAVYGNGKIDLTVFERLLKGKGA